MPARTAIARAAGPPDLAVALLQLLGGLGQVVLQLLQALLHSRQLALLGGELALGSCKLLVQLDGLGLLRAQPEQQPRQGC
jgi:hypothetical protein